MEHHVCALVLMEDQFNILCDMKRLTRFKGQRILKVGIRDL